MIRLLSLFLLIASTFLEAGNPIASYLTWQHDPTTTMTVQWLTKQGQETHSLYYKREGDENWVIALAEQIPLPDDPPYVLHRVEIYQLEPGSLYLFKPGDWEADTRRFRTLSNSPHEALRFVVGGDMYHDEISYLVATHRAAAKQNPHFAVAGGDIAYTATKHVDKGTPKNGRWITYFKAWSDEMVTTDGVSIPLIGAIGNHDVNGRYGQPPEEAALFYTFFPFPNEKGYQVFDIGNYCSLIILDSGHTNRVYGKQSEWLENTLSQRAEIPHKFAAYHVPSHPSVRKYMGTISVQERRYWVPLFEKYHLSAAFEHHDHAYKRTLPILGGHIDQEGVVYLGDGAYGVEHARLPKSPYNTWYLAQTAQERHFILVTLEGSRRKYQAINDEGRIFDQFEQESLEKYPPSSLN